MVKIKKHIEIVRSSRASLSSMGKKSCDMISGVLEQYYENVGITIVNDVYDLGILAAKQPDLTFLGAKMVPAVGGSPAQVWLSGHLEAVGLNYTGSTAAAIALDFDKPTAKQAVQTAGLKTAAYFVARPGQYQTAHQLPLSFPLFIKPPNTGGGKGVGADSVVRDFAGFVRKVQSIAENFQSEALVETYLPGREFSVAILETVNTCDLITMPIELITAQNDQGDRILGQKIKAADTEHAIAVQGGDTKKSVTELAEGAFRALGARDYGRIDIRLDEAGIPHFLEANLIPGLAQHDFTSYFTTACLTNQAMDYQTMILNIVNLALSRDANLQESAPFLGPEDIVVRPSLKPAFEAL